MTLFLLIARRDMPGQRPFARGDLFGDDELEEREVRRVAIVASGPTWLVAVPRDVFLLIARRDMPGQRPFALCGARDSRARQGKPSLGQALAIGRDAPIAPT